MVGAFVSRPFPRSAHHSRNHFYATRFCLQLTADYCFEFWLNCGEYRNVLAALTACIVMHGRHVHAQQRLRL